MLESLCNHLTNEQVQFLKLGILPTTCAILPLNKKTLKDHTRLWETRYTPNLWFLHLLLNITLLLVMKLRWDENTLQHCDLNRHEICIPWIIIKLKDFLPICKYYLVCSVLWVMKSHSSYKRHSGISNKVFIKYIKSNSIVKDKNKGKYILT